jgi:hypothetical protein
MARCAPFPRRTGLKVLYKITEVGPYWVYECRACPLTYRWPVSQGPFRVQSVEKQRLIRDHYLLHGD